MKHHDTFINRYDGADIQAAFRTYFGELGCQVTNWEGLFAQMTEEAADFTWLRTDNATGKPIGFVMMTVADMTNWFFTARCGFIREFWVARNCRKQGHGRELLQMAEKWLAESGCAYALLTTSTAPGFYEKHGYTRQRGVVAKNAEPVYVKCLCE